MPSFLSILFKQSHKLTKNVRRFFGSYAEAFKHSLRHTRQAMKAYKTAANALREALVWLDDVKQQNAPHSVIASAKRAVVVCREQLAEARQRASVSLQH